MQQKSERLNPSLEEIINTLKQANLNFFEKIDLCSLLVERLSISHETDEDKMKWLLSLQLSTDVINHFFCTAVEKGHLAFVTLLTTQGNVEATTDNNAAIRWAAENGHLDMAHYLMTLPGVDPTAQDNAAICWAAENGHLDMVKYLMTLPGVDPTAQNNAALFWAAKNGHLAVANCIGSLPIYNPFAATISAVEKASRLNFLRELNLEQAISSHLVKTNHKLISFFAPNPNAALTSDVMKHMVTKLSLDYELEQASLNKPHS